MLTLTKKSIPKTTPMAVQFDIEKIQITCKDGRKVTIYVNEDQGFYRESVMQLGDKQIEVQEVFITDGKVLKGNAKHKLGQS